MLFTRALKPTKIILAEEKPFLESGGKPIVQVLRCGKFDHPQYGTFEITTQVLTDMVNNFKTRVRGQDIPFDYFHEADKEAAGWVKDLVLNEDGSELWATVDWTPKAEQMLKDREIRYFSPDFAFQWKDPESGQIFKNVLFGGGLTNRPFVKEMAAIVAQEEGDHMKNFEEMKAEFDKMKAENLKLSESVTELTKKLGELPQPQEKKPEEGQDEMALIKKQLEDMKVKCAQLEEENKKMKEAKYLAEKTSEFEKLLSEGKAVAAQKESFLKGDMSEFIKLAQPVNLNGKGSVAGKPADADDDKIIELAEKKVKESGIDMGAAISQVRAELRAK